MQDMGTGLDRQVLPARGPVYWWTGWFLRTFPIPAILLGQMGIWQKWLGSWARWWNTQIIVNPTQVHEQIQTGHPVVLIHLNSFCNAVNLNSVLGNRRLATSGRICRTPPTGSSCPKTAPTYPLYTSPPSWLSLGCRQPTAKVCNREQSPDSCPG